MLDVPVFHVNGEDLEAVAQAVLLAADFRQRFHRDAVIDLWTYRKHGHNEGDEPTFTQPVMYRAIAAKTPFPRAYAAELEREGVVTAEEVDGMARAYQARLEQAYAASAAIAAAPAPLRDARASGAATGAAPSASSAEVATAVPAGDTLRHVGRHLSEIPAGFTSNPKVAKLLEAPGGDGEGRRDRVDWGFAELLAYGTIGLAGPLASASSARTRAAGLSATATRSLRLQERRALHAARASARGPGDGRVYDSLLSEAAALGFEYGYSLEMPEALVIWEAQFGDFVNGAQVVIDQFLSSSETKWNRLSGLVLLLPHGMEGQGPEHSSARLERFLELSVEDNWQVANLTTPAQIFHALAPPGTGALGASRSW